MPYRMIAHAFALSAALVAFPAGAQEPTLTTAEIETELLVGAVSDYRYRGVSLSDQDPAAQAQLTFSHGSGVYVSAWVSTIADNGGADIETQALAGYSAEFGRLSLDLSASYYLYPGAAQDNYGEFALRLGHDLGPFQIGALASYAPAQANIGGTDNLYLALEGSLPLPGTPLTVTGSAGIEDGAFGSNKRDWSFGLRGEVAKLDCSLTYIDTARTLGDPNAEATIVLAISKTF